MDKRLLRHYNQELQHLREMGQEFAEEFPKIAGRLGMTGIEVADPYVERLLEGVGFLAARIQLKLDAEFPRFTQALLEIIYPHYLAPTPSMLIARLEPHPDDGLAKGTKKVPRGSALHSDAVAGGKTSCQFQTAHEVTLWPLEIANASYFSYAPDLPLTSLPVASRIKGGIRIKLRTTAGLTFAQTSIDRLSFYIGGLEDVANTLHELCLGEGLGVLVQPAKGTSRWREWLPASSIRPVGFTDDEALLPVTLRSFQGYRLLQEYFAFPQRYRFVEVAGLAPAIARADTSEIEIIIPLARAEATLESLVTTSNFSLFCTPAINLFRQRADRINVSDGAYEYHVVPDRTRPLDFEVYEVTDVVGHGVGGDLEQSFRPFYAAYSSDGDRQHSAYFTTRREPPRASSIPRQRTFDDDYVGSEVFLGLVDAAQPPFSRNLRQISVETLCTNRDLARRIPTRVDGKTDLTLDIAASVASIRVLGKPSRPLPALADGAVAWRAVSHLSLNYLSLVNASAQEGASGLRHLLGLYGANAGPGTGKQIEGIRSVTASPVVRRLPGAGPPAFGRGLEIVMDVEELAFQGGSAFLLASVLHRYFARYVSINSFTETVLRSTSRGEVHRWKCQWGARPTL